MSAADRAAEHRHERFVDEDWYGRELVGEAFVACVLRDVDLASASLRDTRLDLGGGVQLAESHGALVDP